MHEALAGEIVARLGTSLVVSGGTTPATLFDVLARRAAPWSGVTVTLADERWVDPASPRSNEHLVRTRLLTAAAAVARFVPLKTADLRARDAEGAVNAAIAAIARPFDVVLLGMGDDGHTASLIPNAEGLARALDTSDPALARAVAPPGLEERMTLTLRALLETRWIAILIQGAAKRAAYEKAMAGRDVAQAPVRAVLHQDAVPVAVFWTA
jgi:6-phosphogluconolactonase